DRRSNDGLSTRVLDEYLEVTFAVLLDAGIGLCAPRRVEFHAWISQLRLWQVRERQLLAEILERYTAELDRLLGAITQTERELRLTRRITSGRHERDQDLLPFGTRTQLESRRLRPRISPEFENKLRLP